MGGFVWHAPTLMTKTESLWGRWGEGLEWFEWSSRGHKKVQQALSEMQITCICAHFSAKGTESHLQRTILIAWEKMSWHDFARVYHWSVQVGWQDTPSDGFPQEWKESLLSIKENCATPWMIFFLLAWHSPVRFFMVLPSDVAQQNGIRWGGDGILWHAPHSFHYSLWAMYSWVDLSKGEQCLLNEKSLLIGCVTYVDAQKMEWGSESLHGNQMMRDGNPKHKQGH